MVLDKIRNYIPETIVIALGSIFGIILMFGTFSKQGYTLYIATKAWSDFASHIPLIRSFSMGANFPPQYPLFPGEPIKYHFVFYYFVGLLEKVGLPIDLALNILSFFGFVFLVFMIYFFAKEVFRSRAVGILSTIFFLFNSSLTFIYFFQKYPLNPNSISQIISNRDFLSFAPYGQGLITAFWNLNIFTNQRHFALSLGLSLLLIYLVIKPVLGKSKLGFNYHLLLGVLFGLSFYLHTAVFLMTVIVLFLLAIAFPKIRKEALTVLLLGGLISIPQYFYSKGSFGFSPKFMFGYLVNNATFPKFTLFWLYNLGLSLFLIPLGFIFANKTQRKILVSFFFLFIAGLTFQFSPEIAANHKFFNYFIIVGNMFSAFFLYLLWNKKPVFKPIVAVLFFLMIFGGIIDIFPIINDGKIAIADYPNNPTASWIKNNTKQDSVFLNTTYLYDPASLVGRDIYQGWPYFAWSQGYDTNQRGKIMSEMLGATDKQSACKLLRENKIDYVEIKDQNPPDPNVPPISGLYKNSFIKVYGPGNDQVSIYSVEKTCE